MGLIIGAIVLPIVGLWLLGHGSEMKKQGRTGDQIACIEFAIGCFIGAYVAIEGVFSPYSYSGGLGLPLRLGN